MIPGPVPAATEKDTERLSRAIRALYEGGVGGPVSVSSTPVTDQSIVVWNGTDGRTVKGSLASVDSTGLLNAPSLPFRGIQVFAASGTFTVPAGVSKVWVEVWGGGGGSGGTGAGTTNGSGAGGGGFAAKLYDVSAVTSVSATVGGGGGAGTNAPTAGGNGGTSSFGTISCTGGQGSPAANGGVSGGAGGGSSGGDINFNGSRGGQNNYSNAGAVFTSGGGGPSFGSGMAAGLFDNGIFPGAGAGGPVANGLAGAAGAAGYIIVR